MSKCTTHHICDCHQKMVDDFKQDNVKAHKQIKKLEAKVKDYEEHLERIERFFNSKQVNSFATNVLEKYRVKHD